MHLYRFKYTCAITQCLLIFTWTVPIAQRRRQSVRALAGQYAKGAEASASLYLVLERFIVFQTVNFDQYEN